MGYNIPVSVSFVAISLAVQWGLTYGSQAKRGSVDPAKKVSLRGLPHSLFVQATACAFRFLRQPSRSIVLMPAPRVRELPPDELLTNERGYFFFFFDLHMVVGHMPLRTLQGEKSLNTLPS